MSLCFFSVSLSFSVVSHHLTSTLHFRKVASKFIQFSFLFLVSSEIPCKFLFSFEKHIKNKGKIKYFTLLKAKTYLLF